MENLWRLPVGGNRLAPEGPTHEIRLMKSSLAVTDADVSVACQYALRFHLIDYVAVRRWGDEVVLARGSAPIWVIDLADCHGGDVDERLRRVPGTPEKQRWQRLLCGLLSLRWNQRQLTIGTMRGVGWALYIDDDYPDANHWGLELDCVGDGYDEGYDTLEALTDTADRIAHAFEPFQSLVPPWMAEARAE